jgi:methylthioribose-1-phosphate isomerase
MSSWDVHPISWKDEKVVMLDQKKLPHEEIYYNYSNPEDVALGIETMVVRGDGAIGVTAAYGLALAAQNLQTERFLSAKDKFNQWCNRFSKTKPTAVNLFWAIERMKEVSNSYSETTRQWAAKLLKEAHVFRNEDLNACKAMGKLGAELIPATANILTHCNEGALAFAGWGTTLGVIRSAAEAGKVAHVYIDQTQPYFQYASLTEWEMMKAQIPATLITDNITDYFMGPGKVDCVIVGAERIARNGDVANKIGTYALAILAKEHDIPFYVAAPRITFDPNCWTGKDIPIEELGSKKVIEIKNQVTAPQGIETKHPGFELTPSEYISAIITEFGVLKPTFEQEITHVLGF